MEKEIKRNTEIVDKLQKFDWTAYCRDIERIYIYRSKHTTLAASM